ncbi:MAG: AraC family transcriptional regulator [Clostridia bacterium]|nr:AraC family transcriptional regulator [Clostridia bacterium]
MIYTLQINEFPRVMEMGRIKQNSVWEHSGRQMDVHLLVYLIDGSCTFQFDNQSQHVRKGDVVFIPANKYYIPHTDTTCEYYFFHFQCAVSPSSSQELKHLKIPSPPPIKGTQFDASYSEARVIHLENHMKAADIYDELMLCVQKAFGPRHMRHASSRLLTDLYFVQMLTMLSVNFCNGMTKNETPPVLFEKILNYIDQNYTEPLTLADLAERFGVSKQYIAALFRRHMKMTTTEYIHMIKLENAKKMLKYSAMNISEISDYLGFSNSYYFSKVFKKYFNMTPTQYIRKEITG